uniref:Uncharacterized protein n=1 Tax=Oryza glumipatula TaxID=40148 RepID=A0A0D9YGQ2_9ORYZ
MRAERDATATGTGRVDDRSGTNSSGQNWRTNSSHLGRANGVTTLLAHLPCSPSGDSGGLIDGGGNRLGSSGGDRLERRRQAPRRR